MKLGYSFTLSTINGALYMVIAYNGVKQIEAVFGDSDTVKLISYTSMGFSFLTYITYMQQTFENASYDFSGRLTKSFAALAPFSALQFLYGGIAGSAALNLGFPVAMGVGMMLYLFRIYSCADSATKTTVMIEDFKASTESAIKEKKIREFLNMGLAINIACAFSIISFIPAKIAAQKLLDLSPLKLSAETQHEIAIICAILSTIGSLPLSFYWLLLGIKEFMQFDLKNIPAFIITALLTIQLFGRVNALKSDETGIEEKALEYFTLTTVIAYTMFGTFSNSKRLVSNLSDAGQRTMRFFTERHKPQLEMTSDDAKGYDADDEENMQLTR